MNDVIDKFGALSGGSQLRRIYQKLQTGGDKVYKEAGLNFKSSWFPVYFTLSQSKSAQSIMGITNQIAFSHITVKNIIRELEGEKLVQMIVNPSDKRSKLVSLSPNGLLLLERLEPIWDSFSLALKDVFDVGHPDMINILSRVNSSLNDVSLDQRMKMYLDPVKEVRNAKPNEFDSIGKLMVNVYSRLDGFPSPSEQPAYYQMLTDIGTFTDKPNTELLVAISAKGKVYGAVVYFSDMKYYGSGGTAINEKNASGFRLLAVDPSTRGKGIGKLLTMECLRKGKHHKNQEMIIHTTKAMQTAWRMYEKIGFKRSEDLDFTQGELPVYGFRLKL